MNVLERLSRIDARMRKDGYPDRLGRCYEYAGQRVIEEPGSVLVHGSIELVGDPIEHAWVLLDAGERTERVFEPTTSATYTHEEFADLFEPKERVRYSREEFLAVLLSVCHWGPYDPEAKTGSSGYDVKAAREAKEAGL